jgi:sugar/nucleoside kinase (ribokinase family)
MLNKVDICGIGGSIVDQQYKVSHDLIEKAGLKLNEMRLASPEEHKKLIQLLAANNYIPMSACGGSATNTIVATSYFGSNAHQLCSIANDTDGKLFLDSLTDAGVTYTNTDHQNISLPTAKCIVLVTPDGKRTMSTCLGISSCFDSEKINLDCISNTNYVYIEGYMVTDNNDIILTILKKARDLNKNIVLSLSDPWVASTYKNNLLQWCSSPVELLFCNDAEALAFTDSITLDEAKEKLKSYASKFVITCGANGAIIYDGKSFITINAPLVNVIDTNGAGDIFAGAFLHRLIRHNTFKQAGEFAAEVAAKLVQHFGARLNKEDYIKLESKTAPIIIK